MPIAESKATEMVAEAAGSGGHFRGPFTPQLGYDGGLDYRWTINDTTEIASCKDKSRGPLVRDKSPNKTDEMEHYTNSDAYTQAKRRGFHFGYNGALDWLSSYHQAPSTLKSKPTVDKSHERSASPPVSQGSPSSLRRARCRWKNPLHLENVHFVIPDDVGDRTRAINRQTTIVQVSPSPPSLPAVRRLPSIADDMAQRLDSKSSYVSNSSTLVSGGYESSEDERNLERC